MTICPLSSVPLTEYSPAAEMVTTLPFTATPPPVKVAPSPVSSIFVAVSSGTAAPAAVAAAAEQRGAEYRDKQEREI